MVSIDFATAVCYIVSQDDDRLSNRMTKQQPTANMNKKLGLPFGNMKLVTICVDVDGTLLNNQKEGVIANEDIRDLLRILSGFKNTKIVVWSGSGELYARQVAREIHVDQFVDAYASKMAHKEIQPEIVIDDQHACVLGLINLIVREK